MYSIRLRVNKRLNEFRHGDKATIGVLMRDGSLRYYYWGGFTLELEKRVKLSVESFTNESSWNPRNPQSKMPEWCHLAENEYLLGSYDGKLVYTYLPFTIVSSGWS